jgi:photosystem II stability/assembly factor-like uncharacterized protein
MAYDPESGTVLMYGGDDGGSTVAGTWSWNGSGWSELHPAVSPPALTQALLADDPQSHRLVLTGGSSEWGGEAQSGTWTWDGASWSAAPQGSLPVIASEDALATDSASGQLILVTGLGVDCSDPATWQWSAGTWVQQHPATAPGPANFGRLAYDPSSGRLILYTVPEAGCSTEATTSITTLAWSWNGSTWELESGAPTGSAGATSTKLLTAGQLVGSAKDGVLLMASAVFSRGSDGWTQIAELPGALGELAASGAAWRTGESVAYDAGDGETVLFGGTYYVGDSQEYLGDSWTWEGSWHLTETGTAAAPAPPTPTLAPTPTPPPSPCASPMPQAGSGDPLENLVMFSAGSGWAQWDSDGAILHTTDGGARWAVASPPLSGDQQTLAASFLEASTAEALTGTLYNCYPAPGLQSADLIAWSTNDGGATWTQAGTFQVPDFPGGTLDFVNPEDGWLSVNQGAAMGSSGMALYRTVDGGVHWSEVAETDPASIQPGGSAGSIPFGGDKGSATFIDPTTGWIGSSTAGTGPLFWVTQDGGSSWSAQSLPSTSGLLQPTTQVLRVWSGEGALVAVGSFAPSGQSTTTLCITTDAGRSWSQIAMPGTGQTPETADFLDDADGWLLTFTTTTAKTPPLATTLWVTTDGGANWTQVSARASADQITGVQFVTSELGWATTFNSDTQASGLLQTSDGGSTWTPVTPIVAG